MVSRLHSLPQVLVGQSSAGPESVSRRRYERLDLQVLWNNRPRARDRAPLLCEMWPGEVRTVLQGTREIILSQRLLVPWRCDGPYGRCVGTAPRRLHIAPGIPGREAHQAKRVPAGPFLLDRAPPGGEHQRHRPSRRARRAVPTWLDLRCGTPAVWSNHPASGPSGPVCGDGRKWRRAVCLAVLLGCPLSRAPSGSTLAPPGALRDILKSAGPSPHCCPPRAHPVFSP